MMVDFILASLREQKNSNLHLTAAQLETDLLIKYQTLIRMVIEL
jgi:hypothetical protein